MPRGRHWYGPGFWKGPGWYPGAGGYRGGYGYGPGPGWGFCRWGWAGAGPYYGPAWAGAGLYYGPGWAGTGIAYGPVWNGPEDEKAFLREQAEAIKAELAELEKRLHELENE